MAYEYTNKIKLAFCFTIVLLLQGCPPFGNDLPNSFRQSNHTPAPTGGWAVCYTTGLRFSINAGAGGTPEGGSVVRSSRHQHQRCHRARQFPHLQVNPSRSSAGFFNGQGPPATILPNSINTLQLQW